MMDQMATRTDYESYRDSGYEWLGKVPSHWDIKRFKFLYSQSNAGEVIDKSHWHHGDELLFTCQRTPMKSSYPKFKERIRTRTSDLLLTRNGTPYVHLPPDGAIYSNVVQRIRLKPKANRRFIWYALSNSCLHLKGFGDIIESFNMSTWDNLVVPLPNPADQEKIVLFLDKKTAEIDEAITKKQRLIELLKEQKAIMINQAVTKGLNADAPMRDSGVEWISEVPEHWTVKRAKYLFREVDERSKTGQEELLSVSHMTGVTPRSEKNVYMFMAEDYSGSKLCQKDDLIFNIMWAWMGALGVSDRTGIVSPSYGIYRQQQMGMFNPWYLEHLLRSGQYVAEYNRRSTGLHSSRLRLYSHMFFDMEIGFPSRDEQDQIEKAVAEKTTVIDQATQAVHAEIDKLNELRNVTIAEAVTGKIKL